MKKPYLIGAIKVAIQWPTCPWLPGPMWSRWRDMTWRKKDRADYLAKMQRYYDVGGRVKGYAVDRVKRSARLVPEYPIDWDDNIPGDWAMVLAKRWGLV